MQDLAWAEAQFISLPPDHILLMTVNVILGLLVQIVGDVNPCAL